MPFTSSYPAGIAFPNISPIAFSIGPFAIHWYALGYIVGIIFAHVFSSFLLKRFHLWPQNNPPFSPILLDDLLIYATIGIIAGGRLGYVLFYDFPYFANHPIEIFKIWDGGMSFHGGLIGTTLMLTLFAKRNKIAFWSLFDLIATCAPVGFGVVRICNFINSELWGRVTTVPWAVRFPNGGYDIYGNLLARHPSQLYESFLEGFVLFIILCFASLKLKSFKYPGLSTGIFLFFYGLFRIFVEFFRQPDAQLGFLFDNWLTMGMLLSMPLVILGAWLIFYQVKIKNRT